MNIAAWSREVRRLLGVLYPEPSYHCHASPIELTLYPERRVDKTKRFPEHWSAKCGACNCEAKTAEEAAAALISKLEADISARIAAARKELARLEGAQSPRLRLVDPPANQREGAS